MSETRKARREETRKRLLEAARKLFAEHGYRGTRPQDIAREAGVASGTFYLYFEDRFDVFREFSEQAQRELAAEVAAHQRDAVGFEANLRAAFEAVFDYGARNPGVLGAALVDRSVIGADAPDSETGGTLSDRLGAGLAARLRAGMDEGLLQPDYDELLIGPAIVGLVQAAARAASAQGSDRDVLLDNVVRFCARALLRSS